jgi:hypothetical protein
MEFDDVQNIYIKICLGYERLSINGVECFLKHHHYFDRSLLKKKYKEGILIAEKNGIRTEKDYLDFYIEKGWWSQSKEDEIRTLSAFVENLKKSKEKLLLPSQKESVAKTIKEEEGKLFSILSEKKSIIPMTAEQYADKYYNKFYLYYSLYQDELFKKPFAPNENYFVEDLDDTSYDFIWGEVFNVIELFKTENIKYVAASGFFQNLLLLGGKEMSAFDFYGKPVVSLSINQADLFSYGTSYRRAINNATEVIPDYILSDPLNLIGWCEGGSSSSSRAKSLMDRTPNKNKTKGERSGRITSIVGASSTDYKKLGVGDLNTLPKDLDLLSEAEKSGGEMAINQVVKKTDKIK